jgi:hypothetical protein
MDNEKLKELRAAYYRIMILSALMSSSCLVISTLLFMARLK